jgi:hypothetical protein
MVLPPVTCTALSVPNWRLVRSVAHQFNTTTAMGGRYTSKLKLFGCLLNPSHEKQNDKDDQDDADESDATVTIPVPIAAEAATQSTEQEDYENDNEDESERQASFRASAARAIRRVPPL